MKTEKVQKRHFIFQYAWRDDEEVNVQLILQFYVPRRDIHVWSNFPNKPNKILDFEGKCGFEKPCLTLPSVLFIDKMHCLINRYREVTDFFNRLQKPVFLKQC